MWIGLEVKVKRGGSQPTVNKKQGLKSNSKPPIKGYLMVGQTKQRVRAISSESLSANSTYVGEGKSAGMKHAMGPIHPVLSKEIPGGYVG